MFARGPHSQQTQDPTNKKYNGPIDVVRKVFQEAGIRGLYKGCARTPTTGTRFLNARRGYMNALLELLERAS